MQFIPDQALIAHAIDAASGVGQRFGAFAVHSNAVLNHVQTMEHTWASGHRTDPTGDARTTAQVAPVLTVKENNQRNNLSLHKCGPTNLLSIPNVGFDRMTGMHTHTIRIRYNIQCVYVITSHVIERSLR